MKHQLFYYSIDYIKYQHFLKEVINVPPSKNILSVFNIIFGSILFTGILFKQLYIIFSEIRFKFNL